jgi:hypothetical protein
MVRTRSGRCKRQRLPNPPYLALSHFDWPPSPPKPGEASVYLLSITSSFMLSYLLAAPGEARGLEDAGGGAAVEEPPLSHEALQHEVALLHHEVCDGGGEGGM